MISSYEFIVTDSDGLWGNIKVASSNIEAAKLACKTFLDKEICPKGSLKLEFHLEVR